MQTAAAPPTAPPIIAPTGDREELFWVLFGSVWEAEEVAGTVTGTVTDKVIILPVLVTTASVTSGIVTGDFSPAAVVFASKHIPEAELIKWHSIVERLGSAGSAHPDAEAMIVRERTS